MTLLSVGVNLERRKIYISSSGRLAGQLLSNQGCGNTLLSEDLSYYAECSWHFEQPSDDPLVNCVYLAHWTRSVREPLVRQSMRQREYRLINMRLQKLIYLHMIQLSGRRIYKYAWAAETCCHALNKSCSYSLSWNIVVYRRK